MAHDTAPATGRLPVPLRSRWVGPWLTVAAVAIVALAQSLVTVTSPGLILVVFVAISALLGGIRIALASALITVAFVAVDASAPGQLFVYDDAGLSELVLVAISAASMAVLVGTIQQRLEAQHELLAARRSDDRPREMAAQLLQVQQMDAIGRLAGGVAHDFNNLLTAIGGYVEQIGSTFDPSDPRQAHIAGIRQAIEQAASITRQLLTLSPDEEPLPRATPTGDVGTEPSIHSPQVGQRHGTILVAEDEAVVREMVVAALERLGYRVMAASTGEEAVRLIDRLGDEIDLLLSDVVMPGMSGPDLLDRARRTRPELRAIFMSGYTALTIGRPIQAGVTLLEKPFSGARLGEVVRETLAAEDRVTGG